MQVQKMHHSRRECNQKVASACSYGPDIRMTGMNELHHNNCGLCCWEKNILCNDFSPFTYCAMDQQSFRGIQNDSLQQCGWNE